MPPLPTRLMAGLSILKHTFDLSDDELCTRWVENPYFQYLCGEEFFCHGLPFDRPSLTRWRCVRARNGWWAFCGELGSGGEDGSDEAIGCPPGGRRHYRAAQERDVPHRWQADPTGRAR